MKTLKIIITLLIFVSASQLSAQSKAKEVYHTKKGDHYHKKDCWTIKKSEVSKITLTEAKKKSLTACRVCHGKKKKSEVIEKKSTNKTKISSKKSTQCTGITEKGERCKRMTKSADGTCWQH